jgi:hypothetical protein
MQAAVGDVNAAHPGPEIVASSAAGPVYVFDVSGQSVFGSTAAGDIPLFWSGGVDLEDYDKFGANRSSEDLIASFVGFGGTSVGDVAGDGAREVVAPTAGITRLIDLLLADLQLPNDDQVSGWDGATRMPLPGSPQTSPDLAFFAAPAIADLDGDGDRETIVGNGVYTLSAFDSDGHVPAGWPKVTGGWTVGTPAVGDWDGDGTVDVATTRRDGVVLVWGAAGSATTGVAWAQYGCDLYHSGACVDTAVAAVGPTTTTTTQPATTTTEPPSTSTTSSPTSTTSTTSTTTPATTTSTATGDVGASDVAAPGSGGTTGSLPLTGADVLRALALAVVLLAGGAAAVATARARRRPTGPGRHPR